MCYERYTKDSGCFQIKEKDCVRAREKEGAIDKRKREKETEILKESKCEKEQEREIDNT